MAPGIKVIWEDLALKLLNDRDRYTRQAVQDEFRRDPRNEAIEYDKDQGAFLTPVTNKRFYVVWYQADTQSKSGTAEPVVVVRAVLALTNVNPDSPGLKEYVERAIKAESKGEFAS